MGCQIAIVGEAWGREEEEARAPFVGASGRLLRALCLRTGIRYADCLVTNVFNLRPQPTNDVTNLCGGKADALPGYPSIQQGKYIDRRYAGEVERLHTELRNAKPNLIIALGNTACWAILRRTGISKLRGTTHGSSFGKVLPTYHPAAILRDGGLFPVAFADLNKAREEAEFPEVRRPKREIWIEPAYADLERFLDQHILPSPDLSIDIETAGDQITTIGFAPSIDRALVVPIYNHVTQGPYWPSLAAELKVWDYIRHLCTLPKRVVGQNFLYDAHFLWRQYGIPVPFMADDAMLIHHALQPEMRKGLGFLASVYTREAAWKFMRDDTTGTNKLED